ncbi:hypothetical protein BpHYR1_035807 [Brachionus plicatilis]|uniref:Uncharacterized protein n=1 Tax=Brachionus plicatilis TaxID=10195 RepID=A0A3M7SIW6_BRAPC|nr:hypothetical protein BpHYR1_035807 [Brachionus plicatilis]
MNISQKFVSNILQFVFNKIYLGVDTLLSLHYLGLISIRLQYKRFKLLVLIFEKKGFFLELVESKYFKDLANKERNGLSNQFIEFKTHFFSLFCFLKDQVFFLENLDQKTRSALKPSALIKYK